jgi:hypothetical protein
MILDEESLDGEIRGLGFANPGDWTIDEMLGVLVLVFLGEPISNLLRSKSQGGFGDFERFICELSILIILDLQACFEFLCRSSEIILILATMQRIKETPIFQIGEIKKSIVIHREPKAIFHKGQILLTRIE